MPMSVSAAGNCTYCTLLRLTSLYTFACKTAVVWDSRKWNIRAKRGQRPSTAFHLQMLTFMSTVIRSSVASLIVPGFLKESFKALHCRFLHVVAEQLTVHRCVSPSRSNPLLLATGVPSVVPAHHMQAVSNYTRRICVDGKDTQAPTC
jgi:hypothetical protein